MRENRTYGLEGGAGRKGPSLPLCTPGSLPGKEVQVLAPQPTSGASSQKTGRLREEGSGGFCGKGPVRSRKRSGSGVLEWRAC